MLMGQIWLKATWDITLFNFHCGKWLLKFMLKVLDELVQKHTSDVLWE